MKVEFKKEDWFYFLVFVFLFLLLFYNFFFKARTFYERDSTLLETPVRMHAVQLLKEGNFALWTDSHGQGQPFLANPKVAIFYPTTLLYLFLPFFVAFKIHYFIHPIIGWLGMYLLAKSYGLSRKASFLASSLFFFSGMYLSSFEFYNHIAAIAWMMWALFLQRLNRPWRSPLFLLNVLAWALLILAGAPEFIIITGILALGQAFLDYEHLKDYILKLALAVFLASLITAAQLLPSFEMLAQTERSPQAEIWPLELVQLSNLVFPNILGDDRQPGHNDFWGGHLFNTWYPLYYSLYIGFGALILFSLSLFYLKERKTKLWGALGILFFLMSCGKYSPFFFVYQHIPIISSIRYPVKFFIGSIFCLTLMAGLSLDRLEKSALPGSFKKILAIISALLLVGFLIFKGQIISALSQLFVIDNPDSKRQLLNSILYGLVLLVLYTISFNLLDKFKRGRAFLVTFLIAACLLDPVYHNRYINPTVEEAYFNPPSILKEIKAPSMIYRDNVPPFTLGIERIEKLKIMSFYRQTLFPFSGLPYSVKYAFCGDFMATYPSYQKELMKKVKSLSLEAKLKILRYLGCQYYLGNKPMFFPDAARKIVVGGFTQYLEKISDESARPTVVFKAIRAEGLDQKLSIFISPEFDPQIEVVVNKSTKIPGRFVIDIAEINVVSVEKRSAAKKFSIDVLEEKSGYGRYRINLDGDGIAVFPGNWAKGWKAWVDGKRVEVFEDNLFSKGVLIPAGEHLVVLKYWPDSFVLGSILSLLSLGAIIILWAGFYFQCGNRKKLALNKKNTNLICFDSFKETYGLKSKN